MVSLGIWACAVGVADLVAPTEPVGVRGRLRIATVALPVVAAVLAAGLGLTWTRTLLLAVASSAFGAAWLWLWARGDRRGELGALAALGLGFVVLILSPGQHAAADAPLSRLLSRSPFNPADPDEVVLYLGLALLLVATANRIVRIVLSRIEQGLLEQEQQLKGGRIIGVLERLLVFGLGISGQLAAAGLVVAAKSLLRFGEVRGDGRGRMPGVEGVESVEHSHGRAPDSPAPRRAELMSEYLLVGSLLSWSLAFLAVGVAAAAT